jgi:putative flippase GtrA
MRPARALANRIGLATRRPANWMQLLKFSLIGGSGYLVNLAVFAVLAGLLGMHYVLAAVIAFCVGVSSNFFWNRRWTFGPGGGHAGFQAVRFLTVSIVALLVNLAVLEMLVVGTPVGKLAAQAIAVALAMPFNFVGNKLWTFADPDRE